MDDRDSRISHLEAQIAELLALADRGPLSRPSALISPSGDEQLASEVAGLINVQALCMSAAAAQRSGAGDSDSETSDDPVWPSLRAAASGGAWRREEITSRNQLSKDHCSQ